MPSCSVFTAALAILTGLTNSKAKKEHALAVLDELIEPDGTFLPSPIMFHHCLEAWFKLGESDRAWQAVRQMYESYIETGATQWPEHFGSSRPDAQGVGSSLNYILVRHMLGLFPRKAGGPWEKSIC